MENKRAHLEMLQAIITRMSTNSFLLKGWSVTLASALLALASSGALPLFVHLAYFPALVFWILDGYFSRQERLFRKLYDRVRRLAESDVDFSMDTSVVDGEVAAWFAVVFSNTLLIFHGAVVGSIVIVMLLIVFNR